MIKTHDLNKPAGPQGRTVIFSPPTTAVALKLLLTERQNDRGTLEAHMPQRHSKVMVTITPSAQGEGLITGHPDPVALHHHCKL